MPLLIAIRFAAVLAVMSLPLSAWAQAPELPVTPFDYSPGHSTGRDFARLDNTPADNPVTKAGATLGRVLFYDRQLSANGLVACASCHKQAAGFGDGSRFSIGFRGRITARAAMPLANARYNPRGRYFRDERAASLERQVLVPFTDETEMGLRPGQLVERVRERDWYEPLFANAFGGGDVTEERIAAALAQFVRSLTANRSRYDRARSKAKSPIEPFASFTLMENRGKHLFFADRDAGGAACAACHETDALVMLRPRNNGLDGKTGGTDPGLGGISGNASELGLFRAPSLKNIAITAPYMHDGRLPDLEAVIDHYSSGIKAHPNLSPELKDAAGNPLSLALAESDKEALIAFLETLTDDSLTTDRRFSNPFRQTSGKPNEE